MNEIKEVTFGLYMGVLFNINKNKKEKWLYFMNQKDCENWLKCFCSTPKYKKLGIIYKAKDGYTWEKVGELALKNELGVFNSMEEFKAHKKNFDIKKCEKIQMELI